MKTAKNDGAQAFSRWVVQCVNPKHKPHTFKTLALNPSCSKCHGQNHIKWIREDAE